MVLSKVFIWKIAKRILCILQSIRVIWNLLTDKKYYESIKLPVLLQLLEIYWLKCGLKVSLIAIQLSENIYRNLKTSVKLWSLRMEKSGNQNTLWNLSTCYRLWGATTTHVVINSEPTIQSFSCGGMCSQHFSVVIYGKSWSCNT